MDIQLLDTLIDMVTHIAPTAVTTALFSFLPPILWLGVCFFLNRKHPHRTGFLMGAFFFGAVAVIISLPVETFAGTLSRDATIRIILWAVSEEGLKLLAVLLVIAAYRKRLNGPRDLPIIAVTVGLGFAALENGLYVLRPVLTNDLAQAALSSWLRFLGANLLHAVTTSLIGLAIGFAYFYGKGRKFLYGMIGLGLATVVHSLFNILIVESGHSEALRVFRMLWVVVGVIAVAWVMLARKERPDFIAGVWAREYAAHKKILQDLIVYFAVDPMDTRSFESISKEKARIKRGELTTLIRFIREQYANRLGRYGMSAAESSAAALKGVTENLSPKTGTDLLDLLDKEEHSVSLGHPTLEVSRYTVDS